MGQVDDILRDIDSVLDKARLIPAGPWQWEDGLLYNLGTGEILVVCAKKLCSGAELELMESIPEIVELLRRIRGWIQDEEILCALY